MPRTRFEFPLSEKNGELYFENCKVSELAKRFGTPTFAVSETQLRNNVREFTRTYKSLWPDGPFRLMPSLKANPLVAVRRILTEEGAGCDVFGVGEFECAKRGLVPAELISVNGSIKGREIIRDAIKIGARIVVDSPRELALCQEEAKAQDKIARIMFRLKPDLAGLDVVSDYAPDFDIRFMTQVIKYGIPTSELMEMALAVGDMTNVEVTGVHVHMGRHSKRTDVWTAWIASTVDLINKISKRMGDWQPSEINLGGGMPSRHDLDTDVTIKGYQGPTVHELAETITGSLRSELCKHGMRSEGVTLEIEPGRALHCDTGIHFSTVRNLKQDKDVLKHRWAEVDTSQMFLGVGGANFQEPKFQFVVANKCNSPPVERTDIVGQTCNLEVLFYQVESPGLEIGDTVALLYTGSYIEPCAQNFNALPRPGTLLVNGSSAEWIKCPETVDDVFRRDIVPERFDAQNKVEAI